MTTIVVLRGPINRGDIPSLCERIGTLLEGGRGGSVVCDVGSLRDPDAVTIDALAQLQLSARALGCRLWLMHACGKLQELIDLVGLNDVFPILAASGVEMIGQSEEWEQVRGVEEEADAGDVIT